MTHRILVADDSSTIQKVIKIAFAKHGVEIIEASSYIEALGEASKSKPSALIIDASLPGARGAEDFAKLKSQSADVPLLLLIGTYEKVDEAAFQAKGLAHFLKKPFESADIVGQVDSLLNGTLIGRGEASPSPPPPPVAASAPTGRTVPPIPPPIPGGDTGAPDFSNAPPPPPPPGLGRVDHAGFDAPPPVSSMGEEDESSVPRTPMMPVTEASRRGRPAFAHDDDADLSGVSLDDRSSFNDPRREPDPNPRFATTEYRAPPPPVMNREDSFASSHRTPSVDTDQIEEKIHDIIAEKLPGLVREAVEEYCDRHFNSLAREVISGELRRLADEKARHLVDS